MSEALRFNEGKPKLSYFMRSFPKMAEAVARVKEFGANKYNEGNWRQGNKPDQEYWDSLFRHLNYIFDGEMYDQDSGCLHLGHAVWNLCALLELNYPDMPAVDEELFHERMAYWAHQKKLREAGEQYPCSEVEFIGPSEPMESGCKGECPNGCGQNDGCSDCSSSKGLDAGGYAVSGDCGLRFVIENEERVPSFQRLLDTLQKQMIRDIKAAAERKAIEAELAAVDEVIETYDFEPATTSEKVAAAMEKMDQGGIPIKEIRRNR